MATKKVLLLNLKENSLQQASAEADEKENMTREETVAIPKSGTSHRAWPIKYTYSEVVLMSLRGAEARAREEAAARRDEEAVVRQNAQAVKRPHMTCSFRVTKWM